MTGHNNYVTKIAISPDGSKVISGSFDKEIKIWNLSDGTVVRTLTGHNNYIWTVAVTPDGSKIVSGSKDGEIKIWNFSDGTVISTLTAHGGDVRSIAITPDGSKFVSGSSDSTIKIWNFSDTTPVNTLTGNINDNIRCVAITPDGSKIVSGRHDKTVKIWNLSTGTLIRTLTGHSGYVLSVAVSPDGSKIVSGGWDNTIKVWNFSDESAISTLGGHSDWIESVAVTPDGTKIISGADDNTIRIWKLSDGTFIRKLDGHGNYVNSVAATPDNSKIVSGSEDKTLKIWDISDLLPPSMTKSQSKSRSKSRSRSRSISRSKSQSQSQSISPEINPADWYSKKRSQGFGFKVALLDGIAIISVPFCINPSNPNTCDGGNILTYKMDDPTEKWMKHKKLRNPFRNRDNRFGRNMVFNSYYLIVSAPGSNYNGTDVGVIVFYKRSQIQDNFLKDSIIRYRKVTKSFEFGTSISNIDKITAIGMPICDASTEITNSGCAHVYGKKDNGKWGNHFTITVAGPKSNDRFGYSVSLGSDTSLAVSNNPDDTSDQAVFVYGFEDDEWKLLQTLPNNNKLGFGWRVVFRDGVLYVSIVNDGTDKVNAGSIASYTVGGDNEYIASSIIKPKTSIEGKHFGFSLSFSSDGSRLAVGARPCDDNQACNIKGSVHIFTKNAGDWIEDYLVESHVVDGSDGYGHDVAVDGNMILVSAPFDSTGPLAGKSYFIKK